MYDELMSEISNLDNPNTKRPFTWASLGKERQKHAAWRLWKMARPGSVTKTLYDYGAPEAQSEPNWVTIWLMRDIFRSRHRHSGAKTANGDRKTGYFYDPIRDQHRLESGKKP